MTSDFQENLATGKVGETLIARYLLSRGYGVLPVYELVHHSTIGQRLLYADRNLIVPDMMAFTPKWGAIFVEAKHKENFSWYRKGRQWEVGVDQRRYVDYREVEQRTGIKVMLMIYVTSDQPNPKDLEHDCCPRTCPSGLFGEWLCVLDNKYSHISEPLDPKAKTGWGTSGMVMFPHETLRKFAGANIQVDKGFVAE